MENPSAANKPIALTEETIPVDTPDPQQRLNVFFRLVIAAATLFVITILAMTASIFGNPAAPPARFLDEYAGKLIAVEVAATLVFGFLALAVDRRRILRERAEEESNVERPTSNVER